MADPVSDWQRWQDELQRCVMLSLDVTAPAPPLRTVQVRNARYYADRRRILSMIGPERAVAFLREEALRALAGDPPDSPAGRWFRLHHLEFGGPPVEHTVDLMNAGVQKLEEEGFANVVAEYSRSRRCRMFPPCADACMNSNCEGPPI